MRRDEYLPSPTTEKGDPFIDEDVNQMTAPEYQEKDQCVSSSSSDRLTTILTIPPPSPPIPCRTHNPTPTTHLDTYLTSPTAHEAVDTLTTHLHDTVDGSHCTRCTVNSAARTLTRFLFEVRKGKLSKEEKKALKVEVKGMMREVKAVVREEKGRLKRGEGGK